MMVLWVFSSGLFLGILIGAIAVIFLYGLGMIETKQEADDD